MTVVVSTVVSNSSTFSRSVATMMMTSSCGVVVKGENTVVERAK